MTFYRPIELSELAKETKFIQRNRQINPLNFLELLFAEPGNIAKKSLTELCFDLSDRGVSISKQGLNERFNEHSVEFLKIIFLTLFEMQMKLSVDKNKIKSTLYFNTIRILDGTSIKLAQKLGVFYRGTSGAGVKCQFEFDLLTGVMHYLELQDGKSADSPSGMKRLDSLQENDLILQDTGYFNRETFKKIDEAKAYYVSRAPADTSFHVDSSNPRYHKDGRIMEKYAYERLCLEDELQTIGRGEVREYQKVYFGSDKKQPTRLVIYRMSEEQEKRQLERLRRRQQGTSGKIQKKTYSVASISIYITNLPQEVPAREIPELYRYRWQIELVFKSWKSDMMVDFYRSMKKERWECHFYVEVILLLLSLLITYQLKVYFREEKNLTLSERITMREVSKRIWKIWQARDQLEWDYLNKELIKGLVRSGLKKKPKRQPTKK